MSYAGAARHPIFRHPRCPCLGGLPLGQQYDTTSVFGESCARLALRREEDEATLITMNAKGRSAKIKIWTTAAVAVHAAIALILPLRMGMADSSDSSERAVTVIAGKHLRIGNMFAAD